MSDRKPPASAGSLPSETAGGARDTHPGELARARWGRLVEMIADVRVDAAARVRAERALVARVEHLTLGERVAIARRATPAVAVALVRLGEAPAVDALLGNPRTRRDFVCATARSEDPDVLRTVARHPRWERDAVVRRALLENPRTPIHEVLRLGRDASHEELARLREAGRLPAILRVDGDAPHTDARRDMPGRVDTKRKESLESRAVLPDSPREARVEERHA